MGNNIAYFIPVRTGEMVEKKERKISLISKAVDVFERTTQQPQRDLTEGQTIAPLK